MIVNSEEETKPLSREELETVAVLVRSFSKRRKENPIKGGEVCSAMVKAGINLTEPRLRKMINHIRSQGLLPLVATSKGYYCCYDKEEIEKQIQGLRERASAISGAANGLCVFLK